VEGHPLFGGGGGSGGGLSFYFGDPATSNVPAGATGALTSNPFSLKGYSAEDLPTLYFNYFFNASSADTFRVLVREASGATTVVARNNAFGQTTNLFTTLGTNWRQARVDLSPFAGQENLRLVFDYIDATPLTLSEGAYIDDLIIGFAERGEMVSGVFVNGTFINNPRTVQGSILQGDYQLEIRTSTPYGHSLDSGPTSLRLDRSFDTNDVLAQHTQLIAPRGDAVVDGQTFSISDGVNEVTFEFDNLGDPINGNRVDPAHVAIPFNVTDADHLIARRIRDAINSPSIQLRLRILAAMSDKRRTTRTGCGTRFSMRPPPRPGWFRWATRDSSAVTSPPASLKGDAVCWE
jgi:hypothetical protein